MMFFFRSHFDIPPLFKVPFQFPVLVYFDSSSENHFQEQLDFPCKKMKIYD